MPNGLITPGLVWQIYEAGEDYRVTATEFSEIMGTIASIVLGAFIFGTVGMLIGAISEGVTKEATSKSSRLPSGTQKRIEAEVAHGFPTIEEAVKHGREAKYPECCVQYYVQSRLNPNLPRWLHPTRDYIVCPKHARELHAKPTYTWAEALKEMDLEELLREC